MSAYDPYRFLPPQARTAAIESNQSNVYVPCYGSPDFDLDRPMSDYNESFENGGGGQDVGYEDGGDRSNGNGNGNGNESGPSRKRTRVDDEARAPHSSGRSSMGAPPSHEQSRQPQSKSQSQSQRQRPIPVSMFGLDARNDLTREIGNWIVNTCQGLQDIEIEIKLGRIILPRRPGEPPQRIRLQAMSEKTVYSTEMPHTFLSDMSKREHGTLNVLLNGIVENPPDPHDRIMYKRIKQKDSFHRSNGQRVRVSTLVDTGEITDIVQKVKIDHLNIYCPNSQLDLRISVSTETKCEMPEGEAEDVRVKDRISYSNSICQTDLTYATFTGTNGQSKHTFEVEVEVIDAPGLLFDSQNDPDRFDKKLISCLDTARILIRNAS